ncbi:MAG: HAD-IB family phosphatase [Patescibacteria group bacterium]|nr:HAD-IB family phosphatase [Patescibacteria group bacterium]
MSSKNHSSISPPAKNKIAIFDIDGTIFRKNLQFELLDGLAYAGIFSRDVRKNIVQYYRDWLNNRGAYETYRRNLVQLYNEELKGKNKADVIKSAKRVAAFHHGRLFIFARRIIRRLRKTHRLLAISGSPIEIVREFNAYLKFDDVFGTIYEIDADKKYTGREIYTPVRDKADALKRYVAEKGISLHHSFGIGDTESDASVLELVENPIAFNPNLNLFRIAQKNNWKIVVERKDVIYEIN